MWHTLHQLFSYCISATAEEATDQLATLRTTGAANRRSVLRGGRQSARQSVRVLDGLILDTQKPITGQLLLEQRLPTFDTSAEDIDMSALAEDDYEDWKQVGYRDAWLSFQVL